MPSSGPEKESVRPRSPGGCDGELALDQKIFPLRPAFNMDGVCRMNVGKCAGFMWTQVRDGAFRFFEALLLK